MDPRRARHSNCGRWTTGRWVYDRSRWDKHVDTCKKRPVNTLFDAWQKRAPGTVKAVKLKQKRAPSPIEKPCPGIKSKKLETYLSRMMITGGGAPSETSLARRLYQGRSYANLTADEKKDVQSIRLHQRRWVNVHHTKQVFATDCHKTVRFVPKGSSAEPPMCSNCAQISKDKTFKAALAQPVPEKTDRKYTPRRYRTGIFAEIFADTAELFEIFSPEAQQNPLLQYTIGNLEGRYNDELFTGIAHALLVMHSKEERGVGMQNFQYMPAYDEFMQIVHAQSPSTAKLIGTHLPVRSERFRCTALNMRENPRFPSQSVQLRSLALRVSSRPSGAKENQFA